MIRRCEGLPPETWAHRGLRQAEIGIYMPQVGLHVVYSQTGWGRCKVVIVDLAENVCCTANSILLCYLMEGRYLGNEDTPVIFNHQALPCH